MAARSAAAVAAQKRARPAGRSRRWRPPRTRSSSSSARAGVEPRSPRRARHRASVADGARAAERRAGRSSTCGDGAVERAGVGEDQRAVAADAPAIATGAVRARPRPWRARPKTSVSTSSRRASPARSTSMRRSKPRAVEQDGLLRQPVEPRARLRPSSAHVDRRRRRRASDRSSRPTAVVTVAARACARPRRRRRSGRRRPGRRRC